MKEYLKGRGSIRCETRRDGPGRVEGRPGRTQPAESPGPGWANLGVAQKMIGGPPGTTTSGRGQSPAGFDPTTGRRPRSQMPRGA